MTVVTVQGTCNKCKLYLLTQCNQMSELLLPADGMLVLAARQSPQQKTSEMNVLEMV